MISADDLMHVLEEKEPSMTRETYTIVLDRPAGVSGNAMKRYIKEAIEAASGSFALQMGASRWEFNAVVRRRSIMETEADGSTQ